MLLLLLPLLKMLLTFLKWQKWEEVSLWVVRMQWMLLLLRLEVVLVRKTNFAWELQAYFVNFVDDIVVVAVVVKVVAVVVVVVVE
jgi:hypothetical protein